MNLAPHQGNSILPTNKWGQEAILNLHKVTQQVKEFCVYWKQKDSTLKQELLI